MTKSVALFASAFYPSLGGVEELVRHLAHEYQRRGMDVLVVTNRWPRHLPRYEEYEGIPVYRFALRAPEPSLKAKVTFQLTTHLIRRRIATVLRRHKVEVVHVQCVSANGHYARLAAQDLGVPLVVTSQGERTMDADGIYDRSGFLNKTLRTLLRDADAVTACSKATLDDLEEWYGETLGERATVVFNGISLEEFDDPSVEPALFDRPYVFAIGRLVPQKGFDNLVRAFSQALGQAELGHDLVIAGDGPEQEHLRCLAGELGVGDRVHLVGRTDRPATIALFKGCSFFVLPSRREPFGIVNAEAMAAGKAIVATEVGGVPEIVKNRENGILVPPDDVDALGSAIAGLAGIDRRAALADIARSKAGAFAWPGIASQYCGIYALVGESRSHEGCVRTTPEGGQPGT